MKRKAIECIKSPKTVEFIQINSTKNDICGIRNITEIKEFIGEDYKYILYKNSKNAYYLLDPYTHKGGLLTGNRFIIKDTLGRYDVISDIDFNNKYKEIIDEKENNK